MKIFQRVQEIWSGQKSATEGQTDRQMDGWTDEQTKAISIIPHTLRGRGLKTNHKPLLLEIDQLKDINGLNIQTLIQTLLPKRAV